MENKFPKIIFEEGITRIVENESEIIIEYKNGEDAMGNTRWAGLLKCCLHPLSKKITDNIFLYSKDENTIKFVLSDLIMKKGWKE
jgi:hypothetical protein